MKYLIEIHHGIGDIIQMTGIVETIFRGDSEAKIDLILNKDAYRSLFQYDERIHEIYIIDLVTMSKTQLISTAFRMRKNRYDYMFISPISNRKMAEILCLLVNPAKACGEQLTDIAKISRHYVTSRKKKRHIVVRNENVFCSSGLNFKLYPPKMNGLEEMSIKMAGKYHLSNGKKAAICIGTSLDAKMWPAENYFEIAKYLETKGYEILLIGGGKEKEICNHFSDTLLDSWVNLNGELSLIESSAVISSCEIVIGGDTGMMHIAAAVGCSTLTLFSCTNPLRHCPYSEKSYFAEIHLPCQYCYYTEGYLSCNKYNCLDIPVSMIKEILDCVIEKNIETQFYFNLKKVRESNV